MGEKSPPTPILGILEKELVSRGKTTLDSWRIFNMGGRKLTADPINIDTFTTLHTCNIIMECKLCYNSK